jgi:hypothetical protein
MAVTAHRPCIASPATGAGAPLSPLSRLLRHVLETQGRRDLDREASRLLDQSGGRLTDSVEREIARRHLGI